MPMIWLWPFIKSFLRWLSHHICFDCDGDCLWIFCNSSSFLCIFISIWNLKDPPFFSHKPIIWPFWDYSHWPVFIFNWEVVIWMIMDALLTKRKGFVFPFFEELRKVSTWDHCQLAESLSWVVLLTVIIKSFVTSSACTARLVPVRSLWCILQAGNFWQILSDDLHTSESSRVFAVWLCRRVKHAQ